MVSKSMRCSTSRDENVRRASSSTFCSSGSRSAPRCFGRAAHRSGAGSAPARACRRGRSLRAAARCIIFSSSFGSRQNMLEGLVEDRRAAPRARGTPPTASSRSRRAACRCRRPRARVTQSITRSGPTGRPAARSRRAKCMTFSASLPWPGVRSCGRAALRAWPQAATADLRLGRPGASASSPAMRAMSSWYLSSTPSVSLTVSGSSASLSSATSALRPVDASRPRRAA